MTTLAPTFDGFGFAERRLVRVGVVGDRGPTGSVSVLTARYRDGYPPTQTGLDHAIASFTCRTRT